MPPAAELVIVPPPFIAPTKPPTPKPVAFVTENPNDLSMVAVPVMTPMKPPALPLPLTTAVAVDAVIVPPNADPTAPPVPLVPVTVAPVTALRTVPAPSAPTTPPTLGAPNTDTSLTVTVSWTVPAVCVPRMPPTPLPPDPSVATRPVIVALLTMPPLTLPVDVPTSPPTLLMPETVPVKFDELTALVPQTWHTPLCAVDKVPAMPPVFEPPVMLAPVRSARIVPDEKPKSPTLVVLGRLIVSPVIARPWL